MEKLTLNDRAGLYENIIENNWDAIVFANMQGIVEFINPAANKLYGYEGDELVGQNVDIFNSHLTHNTEDIVNSLIANGHWHGELIQRRKDDSTFDALLHVQIIKDKDGVPIGYASNSKDITANKESAKKLKQIISEKETLIREIHHRVKNNLSIVQGMLRLQQSSQAEANLEGFLIDFQNRLSVLAEAHNNLSNTSTLQEINLETYLRKVLEDMVALFNHTGHEINVSSTIDSAIVPIDIAIPCGLIANEVITNAFKHGISKGGVLEFNFINENNHFEMSIQDNGEGFVFSDQVVEQSLGLSLIDGLVSQLDGSYSFENEKGTLFKMKFALES